MNWKSIKLLGPAEIDLHQPVFWRYDFKDGRVEYYCHDRSMTRHHINEMRGQLIGIHFVDPREIKP